jgi:hypothetical protein
MTAAQVSDAQMVGQPGLCCHPVLDRHQRKIGTVALAGFRIDRQRPRRAIAPTQVVDADHEELPGVERLAGPTRLSHQPTFSGSSA